MINWLRANNGSWTDPTAWDSGSEPGATDDVSIGLAGYYTVSLASAAAAASLTISDTNASLVIVDPGGTDAFSGNVTNAGFFGVDSDYYTNEGGSTVTVADTLTNTGSVTIGPPTGGLSGNSTLSVGALAGNGSISIDGSASSQASLIVASLAPQSLSAANLKLNGDALLQFGSGQIGTIAVGVFLQLNGPNALVADAGNTTSNSALMGLVELDGQLDVINGASIALSGDLANTNILGLDNDGFTSEGGSQVTIAGTLTNTGYVSVGSYTNGLSAASTLTAGALAGAGSIYVHGSYGSTPNQATLAVASAAPSSLIAANVTLDGDALLQFGSGQIGTIAAGVTTLLNGPNARIADAGSTTTNSALVGLVELDGSLRLINGGNIVLSGNLTNTGALGLDSDGFTGEGGSQLSVAGTLTNTGGIFIGPYTNGLGAATTLAVGVLSGTGSIDIHGSYGTTPNQASLLVAAAAPASLVAANVTLDGDALLQFGSGQIGTIAAGVSLELNGPNARIADAGSATANSALVALVEIDGILRLINGGSIGLSGNLTNTGALGLDSDGFTGEGGSVLTVAGTLTNAGNIYIGPNTNGIGSATTLSVEQLAGTGGINIHGSYGASPIQASLLVAAAAPTSLVASNITLDGDALLQFGSGQIGTIAAGVSLELNGPNARIADAGSATANSALIGLVELDGSIRLLNEASLAVGGNLTNTGFLGLDSDGFTSEGGSQVTIAGTLTDSGVVAIGPGTNSIGAASTLSTQALTATGGLYIHGSYGASPVQASLLVAAAAPASLVTSNVTLDGDALLQFGSGQIGTIIGGVSLELNGSTARIADSGNTASNSALVGLVELDGSLRLLNGASVAIAGNLLLSGFLGLDSDGFTSEGGSHVTIGGTLTDSGAIDIGPSTNGIGAASSLSTQALAATGGIYIHGSYGASPIEASLLVGSAAPSRLVAANVTLDGDALLQFASGQISIIAAATALELNGPGARIADVASPASSSALTGIGENDGSLRILNGESLAFAGNLLNTGFLGLDSDGFTSEGGSSVSVAGTLTNSGQVTLGPGTLTLSTSDTLTVNGLVNSGGINLYGSSTSSEAKLVVRGAAGNTGNLLIGPNAVLQLPSGGAFIQQAGTTTINGTLDGTVDLAGGALVLGPTDVINGTITFVGTSGTLYLTAGATGTISNFALGDSIVLSGVTASQVTPSYSAATGLTTLTITLTNATTESITLLGDYLAAPFNIGSSPNGSTITTTATAGTAALAVLIANGTTLAVSNVRNTETLNLGTATLGGPALTSSLDVLNGALAPSDLLGGSFAISAPILFTNSGFGAFSSLAAGAEDTAPAISLSSAQLGTFNETIVLTPTDTTSSGIQTPLAVQTIDVVGTIVLPQAASGGTGTGSGGGGTGSGGGTGTGGGGDGGGDDGSDSGTTSGPAAVGWGDVHFITFDGLDYTLQGDGEFILSQSTVPGDSFQVQARMQPFGTGSSVSVLTMIAAAVGTDRVTFGINRSSVVEINGVATSLPGNGQEVQLNGGTLRETGTGTYVINWNSGEQLTVQNVVSQLSISLQLAKNDGAGSIKGLLGSDSGQANDFALSNGTILSNITSAQLYGEYANSWRVTQASSLLDYGPGQTTGTFTDVNFPGDSIELSNLPASVVQSAAVQTGQAGIVNSAIAAEANLDVAATGDQSFLTSAQFAQSVGVAPTAATITPSAAVTPALGVIPEFGEVTEIVGGPTQVSFTIYLTAVASHDVEVNWAVTTPGAGYLGASAFGGTLPSGVAVISAGLASTDVVITVPASAFGAEPTDDLQLSITPTDSTPLFAPTATAQLINTSPEPGIPASLGVAELLGGGTLTEAGNTATLNLGTFAQGSAPVVAELGFSNLAAPGSDRLTGSITSSGDSAIALSGFTSFGPLAGGQTDAAPQITLSTTTDGTFTQTVTIDPSDSNATGYNEAETPEVVTITGTVSNLPTPAIANPGALTAFAGIATQIMPLSVSDTNAPDQPLTVTVTAGLGTLSTQESGSLGVSGNGTSTLTLSGKLADINAALAALTYTDAVEGTDSITITAEDADQASSTTTIAVTSMRPQNTGARLTTPVDTVLQGTPSGLGGLSIIDPYDAAMGNVITLSLTSPDSILSVEGPSGQGSVQGDNSGTITITGTVAQVNAQLADDLIADLGTLNITTTTLASFLITQARHQLNYFIINALVTGTAKGDPYSPGPTAEGLVTVAGPEAKGFLIGVTSVDFELNSLTAAITGGTPPSLADLQVALFTILADAHVVSPQGTIYDFNAEGEFVLAASTQPGDSFIVEVRLQPLAGSSAASVMTQVAASIGTDRVTFGVGRDAIVYVDGVATTLDQGTPLALSGGTLTQEAANTYALVWDTGETLTVTNGGTYLSASVATGPNNTASTIIGLENLSTSAGNDFTLPDGTVLPQPLTAADLAQYFDAFRVSDATSLFDYLPGQNSETFTDTTFPQTQIVLADLPADVQASAAAAVAAAGITDPGIAAAAEFDYIASGGNMAFVQTDASLLAGRSTNQADITPGPVTSTVGVLPLQPNVRISQSTASQIQFEAYLTAASTTDTVIDYTVVAAGAGYLGVTAFGGSLPSGSITIAAGQTEGTINVALPAGALGNDPQDNLQITVTSPSGTPVFAPNAQVSISQPVAGAPPVPEIDSLVSLGTFTHDGNNYTLDLGDVQYGDPYPDLIFGLTNAATAPADALGGTVSATTVDGFVTSGIGLPSSLSPGQSYDGIDVSLEYTKFGPNEETITFAPTDTNASGFAAVLPTETLTIMDNIVAPAMVFSQAWGDVHIVTYNGLLYNFQAVGEFTLAESELPNDNFDIQLRLAPYQNIFGTVSIIDEVGLGVGPDSITIDNTRATPVWIDGAPSTISATDPVVNLAGGVLTQLSANVWQFVWSTGEEATVTIAGVYMNVSDGVPLGTPNTVHGLQGEDDGQANDFQLSDGTVLPQPLSYATLYGPFADSWRLTQTASVLNYGPGQTTATFTDRGYPADYFNPQAEPAAIVAQAASLVAAAGITDPGIAMATEDDYLATGDASFISSGDAVQQQVASTTVFTPTNIPAPVIEAGVTAGAAGLVQAATGHTAVTFEVFLTGTLSTDTAIAWSVVDGSGLLGSSVFGGTLPTGSVTVAAGSTEASFTVSLPVGALGMSPNGTLEVAITPPTSVPVAIPMADEVIVNNTPEPGNPAVPLLLDLSTPANLTATTAQSYTLDLGSFALGQQVSAEQLAFENNAAAPADALTGTATVPIGSGFTVTGANPTSALAAGASYSGIIITPQTNVVGSNTETFALTPKDINDSGYSAALPVITLVIEDQVAQGAQAALNSPSTIVLPNAHVGGGEMLPVSISNTAKAPAGNLDVTTSTLGFAATTGKITNLAAGGTDATDITVGLNETQDGPLNGTVTLNDSTVSSGGTAVPLATTPQINVFGDAYALASASISAPTLYTHVGGPGTVNLTVANTGANDGFTENLIATLAGTSASTGDIAAGQSNATALAVTLSTASAGIQTTTATIDLASDGGTGATSFDGLGQTTLASQTAAVTVSVNNYATAELSADGPGLTAGPSANSYVLDLGTVFQNSLMPAVDISALNAALAPGDGFNGSFTISNDAGFSNTGFAGFNALAAGGSTAAGTVALNTASPGEDSETIILTPTDENAGGFSQLQQAVTLTVMATVLANSGGGAPVDVPAQAVLNTPSNTVLPNVHLGDTDSIAVSLGNTATPPGDALDVTPTALGDAVASGTIIGLAAGQSDATDITAGLATVTAGAQTGTVSFAASSVASDSINPITNPQTLTLSGNVYRLASATINAASPVLHVGGPGAVALTVTNSGTADGYTENLIAVVAGTATSTGDIAAGASSTALSATVSTATAGTVTSTATINLTSDGGTGLGSVDGLGQTALTAQVVPISVAVNNYAAAAFSGSGISRNGSSNVYLLNLGNITQGSASAAISISAWNDALAPADLLDGSFTETGTGFAVSGFSAFTNLAASTTQTAGTITLNTANTGTDSETIILTPTDVNATGFSLVQSAVTLEVTANVMAVAGVALAQAALNSPATITFGNVHVGDTDSQAVSLTNAATAPAGILGVTGTASGAATVSGAITGLAAGASDATDITVGLGTQNAGAVSGSVTLQGSSTTAGVTTAANQLGITLSGHVYRLATGTVIPATVPILHVGDSGTVALQVADTGIADGYTEALAANLIATSGGLLATGTETTGDIAAGQSSSALTVKVSTTTAGTVSGQVTIDLVSDGGTGGGSQDGLGQTALGQQVVAINATVNNYATAELSAAGLYFGANTNSYVLNLGTIQQGSSLTPISIVALNAALAPGDSLNGTISISGSSAFLNSGFGAITGLGAGGGAVFAGQIGLSTSQTGNDSETITLTPTDTNSSGFSLVQSPITLTVSATVVPATGMALGDVHLTTFDGLKYDFQADGEYTLARSTVAGDPFQIQIRTTPYPLGDLASVTTQAAAQVGSNVVTFNLDGSVAINGITDTAITENGPEQLLGGGTLSLLDHHNFLLAWANGETMEVDNYGIYLDVTTNLGPSDGPGSVQGLLGGDNGQENDLALPDGTVLTQPVPDTELLGNFADDWQVAPAQSILDNPANAILQPSVLGAPNAMGFITATEAGQILTGSLGSTGPGIAITGTTSVLQSDLLTNFAGTDTIDARDISFAEAAASLTPAAPGVLSQLQLTDGTHSLTLNVQGAAAGAKVLLASDQQGGTLIHLA